MAGRPESITTLEQDTLGSRFVRMEAEGLGRDSFEFETPFSRFLVRALEAGFHLSEPEHNPLIDQKERDRRLNMMILYAFGKHEGQKESLERRFTLKEIGQIYPGKKDDLTRERVRQLVKEGITDLYNCCSADLQKQYPDLANLILSSSTAKFMVNGIRSTRVIAGEALAGGSYKQIRSEFSLMQISFTRTFLADYGLNMPNPEDREATKKLIKDLQDLTGTEDREIIQQVLDKIKYNFLINHENEFDAYCLFLSDLCKIAGLKQPRRKILTESLLQTLHKSGIAYGGLVQTIQSGKEKGVVQRTFFILAANKDIAVEALRSRLTTKSP